MTAPSQIQVGGSAVTWHEELATGSGEEIYNAARSERRWLVTNCYDPNDLIATAPDNIPPINPRGSAVHMLRSFKYDPAQPTEGGLWIVVASYQFTPEYYELSFETSGATTKLMTALDEGDYYNLVTPGADVPSFGRLVGVSESSIEGVDVPIPKFDFSVLIRNQFATLPATYLQTVGDLSGKANDRPITMSWKGQRFDFETEELLFHGMNGKMVSDAGFELTLKFSKSKGKTGGTRTTAEYTQPAVGATVNIVIADATLFAVDQIIFVVGGGLYEIKSIASLTLTCENLGGPDNADEFAAVAEDSAVSADNDSEPLVIGNSGAITKRGWRYLWTQATRQQAGASRFVLRPSVAVVNKVIRTADLSPIGIFL